jgi:hypothetical protein
MTILCQIETVGKKVVYNSPVTYSIGNCKSLACAVVKRRQAGKFEIDFYKKSISTFNG